MANFVRNFLTTSVPMTFNLAIGMTFAAIVLAGLLAYLFVLVVRL